MLVSDNFKDVFNQGQKCMVLIKYVYKVNHIKYNIKHHIKCSIQLWKHENVNDVIVIDEKIEYIQTKSNKIERRQAIYEIGKEKKLSELSKQVDKKIENFENQLDHLKKTLEEKDLDIINVKKKVEQLEKKCKEEVVEEEKSKHE